MGPRIFLEAPRILLGKFKNLGSAQLARAADHTSTTMTTMSYMDVKYYGDEAVVKEHWPTLNLYMDGLMEGTEGIPAFWTWGDCETGIVVCIRHTACLSHARFERTCSCS